MPKLPNVHAAELTDLMPDPRNANRGSERGDRLLDDSFRKYGAGRSIVVDRNGTIIAGNHAYAKAGEVGIDRVLVVETDGTTLVAVKRIDLDADSPAGRELALYDNRSGELNLTWDPQVLQELAEDVDLGQFWSPAELERVLQDLGDADAVEALERAEPSDEPPELRAEALSKPGDVWILGPHRVMCGDCTVPTDVERLMAGARAQLLHADPPYGMGKEADGVANDNRYGEDLDRFQLEWCATCRPYLEDNASLYIWGNAPDLWRLWYRGGLAESDRLELRNQIVWDKGHIPGMAAAALTQYPIASEHCLFIQRGNQLLGDINAADYWEGWEPLRAWFEAEIKGLGWKGTDLNRVTGSFVGRHWTSRSQWQFPTAEMYARVQAAAGDRGFRRSYSDLRQEYDALKRQYDQRKRETRAYFDNAHEPMTDVWQYPRVNGEERYGHATPKPVAMMERILRSSLPESGLCLEPFGGTGSTLIGAEATGRACYTMELRPEYVDVIVRRWQRLTGRCATLESTGEPFPQEAQ